MSDYKISVLVTFYNQENYVDKALNSVFSQKTSFKFKVIVGDDGSSDNTISLIKKWQIEYPDIEIVIGNHNDGCSISGFRASRNRLTLLKKVATKYFIFLDGDDFFSDESKLQTQYNILENNQNNDCIACAHDINALYPDGSIRPYTNKKVKQGKYEIGEYWRKYYFHTDTILFRSSIIKQLDFDLLENNYNDNMITYSALQFGKVYYIPNAMAVYNQTGDGIWTTGNKITNNVRNMFLYDLCNIINPKLKKATNIRFGFTWLALIRLRKEIYKSNYLNYYKEACDKNLKYSSMWLCYCDGTFLDRMLLIVKSLVIITQLYAYRCISRFFGD